MIYPAWRKHYDQMSSKAYKYLDALLKIVPPSRPEGSFTLLL